MILAEPGSQGLIQAFSESPVVAVGAPALRSETAMALSSRLKH